MKILMRILICVFLFILSSHYSFAQDTSPVPVPARIAKFEVDLGTGVMRGHTTYQIGGDVETASGNDRIHFSLSELKFPLDVYMASLSASAEFVERWKLAINVKKNITRDAGKMKDSDWGIWHLGEPLLHDQNSTCSPNKCSTDSLDIYSESDAELDALIIDFDFRYRFVDTAFSKTRLSFFAGIGQMYENFSFEVSDLDQWYPSYQDYFGIDPAHQKVSGKVLTYDIYYFIPYIRAGSAFTVMDKLGIEGSLAFSPYLKIFDEDDHILRDKVSEGELEGTAVMFSLEGRYNFSRHWSAKLGLDYMTLQAEGEQKQHTGGVHTATIDEEITSEQLTILLKADYSF
ncbi:MAG: omptin family outer membrane protease [Nitrospirae bacterium]|nr:omptin family outer membrane protease [Nitrospirota bacterium]